jgi:pimeloyl-ACP methyl ester carboxylesterase
VRVLTDRVRAWERSGRLIEHRGQRIFVRAQEGSGTPLLFLHGYPSSSYDWRAVLDRVPGRPAVCFDFLGFGLSDKPRKHVYSLHDQADLAEAVADAHIAGGPAVLVAHDMGTSVATELLARDLDGRLGFDLAAVLLLNGSMVIERASLTLAQRALRSRFGPLVARLSNERAFRAQFARLFSSAHPLTRAEAADQWALLAHNGGQRIIDRLTFYLHERVRFAPRWHGALRDWPGHLELAWAGQDPVCTEAVLEAVLELRAHAPLTRLPELGHYPQLEQPDVIAKIVAGVVERAPQQSPETHGSPRPS